MHAVLHMPLCADSRLPHLPNTQFQHQLIEIVIVITMNWAAIVASSMQELHFPFLYAAALDTMQAILARLG